MQRRENIEFYSCYKDPYVFRANGTLVKISFSDTDKIAEDCLTNVLNNQNKKGSTKK